MKVLITGSAGFIGGYVVDELLGRGFEVVGLDNLSKYGEIVRSYDDNPNFTFVNGDARDVELMTELMADVDHVIAGAALSVGSPTSTPTPTTCSPRTSESSPRPAMPRSPRWRPAVHFRR